MRGDAFLDRPMPPLVRQIIMAAADRHQMSPDTLLLGGRSRVIVRARHSMYAEIRDGVVIDHKPPSLPLIGRWVNRHHTAVLYGLKRHESDFEWRRARGHVVS